LEKSFQLAIMLRGLADKTMRHGQSKPAGFRTLALEIALKKARPGCLLYMGGAISFTSSKPRLGLSRRTEGISVFNSIDVSLAPNGPGHAEWCMLKKRNSSTEGRQKGGLEGPLLVLDKKGRGHVPIILCRLSGTRKRRSRKREVARLGAGTNAELGRSSPDSRSGYLPKKGRQSQKKSR